MITLSPFEELIDIKGVASSILSSINGNTVQRRYNNSQTSVVTKNEKRANDELVFQELLVTYLFIS